MIIKTVALAWLSLPIFTLYILIAIGDYLTNSHNLAVIDHWLQELNDKLQ